jgi:DNA-3-methyladenine glycosylase II
VFETARRGVVTAAPLSCSRATFLEEEIVTESNGVFRKAQRHLARRDPVLKALIRHVGPCTLWHQPNHFFLLARAIVSQQISTKAAESIGARLAKAAGRRGITPKGILALSEETLRSAGLSAAKTRYMRDLAEKVHSGEVPLDKLHELEDEEVIERLVVIKGIGRWTAEMFLIFSLGRLDVLPVDDLGLRAGVMKQYGLAELPKKAELIEIGEPWRPYRSIATWYLWRSRGFVPQST